MIGKLFRNILTAELAEKAERSFLGHVKGTDIDSLGIIQFQISQWAGYFRFAGLSAANKK